MLGIPHPYLTPALSGIGGRIKTVPSDFIVSEVPLYTPCGRGEHTYFEVEKVDLSTLEALQRLARALDVDVRDLGYAGLKDRKGVTRQTLSIAGVDPGRVLALDVPQIRVLWAELHTNKLRIGHLRGNRFEVRLRDVCPDAEARARAVFRVIEERGVPNYFGPQRFGNRGNAHRIGRALLVRDHEAAVARILGHPATTEHNPDVVEARRAFMRGELAAALSLFPPTYREERRLLGYLLQAGTNYGGAVRRLGDVARRLYATAYQSYLFNLALARRLDVASGDLGALLEGDVAHLYRNGACFRVTDAAEAMERSRTFEIGPSGPIFGLKMLAPEGVEGRIEEEILAAEGLRSSDFHQLAQQLHLEGGRRPFRVLAEDLKWRIEGTDLSIEFFLPKGSYATTLLRELMKNERVPDAFYEDGEGEKHRLWRPEGAPPPCAEGSVRSELQDAPAVPDAGPSGNGGIED